MPFPKGFFWGAATASHQVEGNNRNDWSEWEKANAERLAHESEQSFWWNPNWGKFQAEATNPANYLSGVACDHWNRYPKDFDILKNLNLNAYRFSIEWSRIEPAEGRFDEAALEHYHQMIQSLRERNIEPFVTLWHWTLPLWLAQKGGILAPDFPKYFEAYTEKVVTALGSDVRFWITLNEPDVISSHAYFKGSWPPQRKSFFSTVRAWYALKRAHQKSYACIKKYFPAAQVGIAKHQIFFDMARPTLRNRILKSAADWLWNRHFLNLIQDSQDFIGLNHYNHHRIDGWYNKNENKIQTDFGWEYYPESLYHALVELKRYQKPIYITENGIADAGDELRQRFIPAALSAVEKAIAEGIEVKGYFYWSLLDNFEWDKGYWLKFGLVAVDRATQERTVRESARQYAELIKKYQAEEK
ncbi:MAG: glycoside hydrolase family 1 protein [Undibacterium sp.]